MLIGLVGKAQSGKSTVASILVERHGFWEIGFADALKNVAISLDPLVCGIGGERLAERVEREGWEQAKKCPEVRRTLQRLGVAVRQIDPNFWVNAVRSQMERTPGADWVIPDVRFENELDFLEDMGGTVYQIVRDGAAPAAGTENHVSETALDNTEFFNVIDNNGTLDDLVAVVNGWFQDV